MHRLAIALLCLTCTAALSQEPSPSSLGWSWALIGATQFEQPSGPAPAPTPSGVCPQCNGTGKVGDGRVSTTCRECDGTGKVTQADTKPSATITIYHSPGDASASKWIAEVYRSTPSVTIRSQVDPLTKWIYFDVCSGSKCYRFEKSLSMEKIESILGSPQQSVARK